ncbi:hypothetical protein BE04_03115 [Sorangium cellulosum]|uniref:Uncharacterized protein n=1 Tax=Sorangium cellulosum TaxID=56 RepID=A0A150P8B3_SORCE|nr:hypothetical protein BE04_03115 [Sorangium cellulosum]
MRSRAASSASSTFRVMTPSAWPVITRGPSGGEARKSKQRPCSGSSPTLDFTGRFSARSCDTSRRLAVSMRRHSAWCSTTVRSGMVRLSRHAAQSAGVSAATGTSQLQPDAVSKLPQRR